MSANTADKITDVRNGARPNSARATGTRSAGATSLACDNLAGWPDSTKSKVHFVTYQLDSSSNPVAGTQLDCSGIVSGNTIGSFTVIDGSDNGNSVGDVVEMLPTAAWAQDLADALDAQHTRTGTHKNLTNTGGMTTDTLNVTSNEVVGGTLNVTGALTPAGGLSAGSVSFAALLSTIFSGALLTQTNGGNAGGTMSYINLGGIKLLWVTTIAFTTGVSTGGQAAITFPSAFFSTITSITATAVNMVTTSQASANVNSYSATGASVGVYATAGGTAQISVLVIGT